MAILHRANQNRLLAALPAQDVDRAAAQLKLVELAPGAVLHDPGEKLQHAHFPTTAIVPPQYFLPSGESAETAGVGNEGMVGTSMHMGESIAESSAPTQAAGFAYRLGACADTHGHRASGGLRPRRDCWAALAETARLKSGLAPAQYFDYCRNIE